MKYGSWLNGELTYIAQTTSLGNAFSKQKHEFPKYENVFSDKVIKNNNKKKNKNEINNQVQNEFNAWARL